MKTVARSTPASGGRQPAQAKPAVDVLKLKPVSAEEARRRYRARTGKQGVAEMGYADAGMKADEL